MRGAECFFAPVPPEKYAGDRSKKHLTQEGLEQILSIKATMNFGESDKLKLLFPNVTPIERPSVLVNNTPLNPF